MGRSIIRIASNNGGRIPEIIPTTTPGRSHIHASQLAVLHSAWTFDTAPTNATGIAQKTMSAIVAAHEIVLRS